MHLSVIIRVGVALLILLTGRSAVSQDLTEGMSPTEAAFRMRIGALSVAAPLRAGPGVVRAEWPAGALLMGLGGEWTVAPSTVSVPNGYGAAREYRARRNGPQPEAQITLEVFVATQGFDGAVRRLVEQATNTMMPEPPWERALDTQPLGELTVRSTDAARRGLMWTFRNVCLRVDASDGAATAMQVARAVQAFLARHVTTPPTIETARPRLQVGDDIVVIAVDERRRIVVQPTTQYGSAQLVVHPDNANAVAIVDGNRAITLLGRQPGRTRVAVVLADPDTLLSDVKYITVDVR